MQILDGKKLGQKIRNQLKIETQNLKLKPGLTVVLVGDDPASQIYVTSKEKACQEIGFYSKKIILPENTSEDQLFSSLNQLNNDRKIHGILVQFPLPEKLKYLEEKIINFINPEKDVDCFNPLNVGKLISAQGKVNNILVPCTPKGIIRLLKEYNIEIKRKRVVICGRSNLVGKPVSLLLLSEDATVTICHSQTQNLSEITQQADILVSAIGKPNFIKSSYVKKNATVIDVGMNRIGNKVFGDVDFDAVKNIAHAITPVPGGVGPMTIAMLMENILIAYKNQTELK